MGGDGWKNILFLKFDFMKLDLNKLYIVYKPKPYYSKKDIFSGEPVTLQEFAIKLKRGLDSEMVEGIYPTKRTAQLVANKLLGKIKKSPLAATVNKKKVTKGYAIFSDAVMAKDKYKVTTPPAQIFATKKKAQAAIKRWEKQYSKKSNFKILTYDASKQ